MIPANAQQLRTFSGRFAHAILATKTTVDSADLLKTLCEPLAEEGYAAFIKLLLVIEESQDSPVLTKTQDALEHLLASHQLPTGTLSAWGASLFWDEGSQPQSKTYTVAQLSSNLRRKYGPVEFLTVWYSQKTHRPYLTEDIYVPCMHTLLKVMDRPSLQLAYASHLQAELMSAAVGAYSNATRQRLLQLAEGWQAGLPIGTLAKNLTT